MDQPLPEKPDTPTALLRELFELLQKEGDLGSLTEQHVRAIYYHTQRPFPTSGLELGGMQAWMEALLQDGTGHRFLQDSPRPLSATVFSQLVQSVEAAGIPATLAAGSQTSDTETQKQFLRKLIAWLRLPLGPDKLRLKVPDRLVPKASRDLADLALVEHHLPGLKASDDASLSGADPKVMAATAREIGARLKGLDWKVREFDARAWLGFNRQYNPKLYKERQLRLCTDIIVALLMGKPTKREDKRRSQYITLKGLLSDRYWDRDKQTCRPGVEKALRAVVRLIATTNYSKEVAGTIGKSLKERRNRICSAESLKAIAPFAQINSVRALVILHEVQALGDDDRKALQTVLQSTLGEEKPSDIAILWTYVQAEPVLATQTAVRAYTEVGLDEANEEERLDEVPEALGEQGAAVHRAPGFIRAAQLGVEGRDLQSRVDEFLAAYQSSSEASVPFGGRGDELKALDAWLDDETEPPRMLIVGPWGGGKSALVFEWLKSIVMRSQGAQPKWQLAYLPISAYIGTNDKEDLFIPLSRRLATIAGQAVPLDSEARGWSGVLRQLTALAETSKHILLVIDGLDEAPDGTFQRRFVPSALPSNIRVLVSARVQVPDVSAEGWLSDLGWSQRKRLARHIELKALSERHITDLLIASDLPIEDSEFRKVVRRLDELTRGDPLLLRRHVEDLRELVQARTREGIGKPIAAQDVTEHEPGFDGYFRSCLMDQKRIWDEEGKDVADIKNGLAILTFAYGGLQADEFLDLFQFIHGKKLATERDLLRSVRRFAKGDGSQSHGYALGHARIGDYLKRTEFQGRQEEFKREFVWWGQAHLRKLNANKVRPEKAYPYVVQFLVKHFKDGPRLSVKEWMELVTGAWRVAWLAHSGSTLGFVLDVEAAREAVRLHPCEASVVGALWSCLLASSTVGVAETDMDVRLLCSGIAQGSITVQEAKHFVDSTRNDVDGVRLLLLLSAGFASTVQQAEELFSLAQRKAADCQITENRAEALRWVTQFLPREQRELSFAHVFAVAKTIKDGFFRAREMRLLAPHLPKEQQSEAIHLASLAERDISAADREGWAQIAIALGIPRESLKEYSEVRHRHGVMIESVRALASLIPYLEPTSQTEAASEALSICVAVPSKDLWASGLEALVPFLGEDLENAFQALTTIPGQDTNESLFAAFAKRVQVERVLPVAMAVDSPLHKVRALASLLPYSIPPLRTRILDEVLSNAAEAVKSYGRLGGGPLWSLLAAAEMAADHYKRALSIVGKLRREVDRCRALEALAMSLPPQEVATAFAIANRFKEQSYRAIARASLSSHLQPAEQEETLKEALKIAMSEGDDKTRSSTLCSLVPYLLPHHIDQLLTVFPAGIANAEYCSIFLRTLASRIPLERIDYAQTLTETLPVPFRVSILSKLAEQATHERQVSLLTEAQRIAESIVDGEDRALSLRRLAVEVREPSQRARALLSALDAAKAIEDDSARAKALSDVAPYVLPHHFSDLLTSLFDSLAEQDLNRVLNSIMSTGHISLALGGEKSVQRTRQSIIETAYWLPV